MLPMFPSEVDLPANLGFGELLPARSPQAPALLPIKYAGAPLQLQTPCVVVPFGMDTGDLGKGGEGRQDGGGGGERLSISLSMQGPDPAAVAKLAEVVDAVDDAVFRYVVDKCERLVKRKKWSDDTARELHTRSLRHSKDAATGEFKTQYPARLKAHLQFSVREETRGDPLFKFWAPDRTPIDYRTLMGAALRGARVYTIMQATSVWFIAANSFGVKWVLKDAVVFPAATVQAFPFRRAALPGPGADAAQEVAVSGDDDDE